MIAAIVLAGGAGQRMGGVDKAALRVAGAPLLERVLAAARASCDHLVVVGPRRPTEIDGVVFTTEAEPGGGPIPAVAAGLAAAPRAGVAVVLATDLPLLRADHLDLLLAALSTSGAGAAAAADRRGPNPLLAAYEAAALRRRAVRLGRDARAGRLLPPDVVAVDLAGATLNVNRPGDLAAAELLVTHGDDVVATTQWLRALVVSSVPEAVESVDAGRHGFGYRHPRAGEVCAVVPHDGAVRLSFEGGARLPDRRGLLTGTGRHVRHVDVRAPGQPSEDALVALIHAAVELAVGP